MDTSNSIIPRLPEKYTRGQGRRIWIIVALLACLAVFALVPGSAQTPSAPSSLKCSPKHCERRRRRQLERRFSGATAYTVLSFRLAQAAASLRLVPGSHVTQR